MSCALKYKQEMYTCICASSQTLFKSGGGNEPPPHCKQIQIICTRVYIYLFIYIYIYILIGRDTRIYFGSSGSNEIGNSPLVSAHAGYAKPPTSVQVSYCSTDGFQCFCPFRYLRPPECTEL